MAITPAALQDALTQAAEALSPSASRGYSIHRRIAQAGIAAKLQG